MLTLPRPARDRLVAHCVGSLPLEGCGLLVGDLEGATVVDAIPTCNALTSALRYEIDAADHLRIDREATGAGHEVLGAFHSHTHTDAWPSPTDVSLAADPAWHWVLVSLRQPDAVVRSFRIVDDTITEEQVVIV